MNNEHYKLQEIYRIPAYEQRTMTSFVLIESRGVNMLFQVLTSSIREYRFTLILSYGYFHTSLLFSLYMLYVLNCIGISICEKSSKNQQRKPYFSKLLF